MGPEFGNQMFMLVGSIMIITGAVMYFVFEVRRDLRDADPMNVTVPNVAISTGLACLLNGAVLGYHHKMTNAEVNILSVLMIACFIWCIFAVGKLIKTVYGERQHA